MNALSRRTALVAMASTVMTTSGSRAASAPRVILYKDPNCGCCEAYASYLGQNLISVEIVSTTRVVEMSRTAGIPEDFEGCHLTSIGGYVVAGHVPIEAIRKLLSERPPLAAITLPGMPAGAPGMSGEAVAKLIVYAIPKDGSPPEEFSFQNSL